MIHLPNLIHDLGFILITAAVVSLMCKHLKQPVVLGYLIAGVLVGPHVPLFPTVVDLEGIHVWAEIGVIFLLFCLGLEFSFKKLSNVGKSAGITAVLEVCFMLGVGYVTGQMFGWSRIDSLFLGGILSISSTTIIVKAFEELDLKGRSFVSFVFGVLIVEDLVAILLLVLLSSVAVTQTFSGNELIYSSLKLGFFLVLWFMMGSYLLPALLRRIKGYLSDETLLIISIGLCLFMVMIATKVGFSPALGAFVMGSLLAETRDSHRIETLLIPVRDLFAAVFFVSVGMMIDPAILMKHFSLIVIITVITIIGKFLSTGVGALISGRSLKTSIQSGMSVAQIGEFSFIIATLGVTLKVTSDILYPVAVAVSAITTFATPYLIKYSFNLYDWVNGRMPPTMKAALNRYEAAMASGSDENTLQLLWSEYGSKIILNTVLVVAIALAMGGFVLPFLENSMGAGTKSNIILCALTLVLQAPFLWAIVVPTVISDSPEKLAKLKRLQFGVAFVRFFTGISLVAFTVSQFASMSVSAGIILFAMSVVGIYFSRYSESTYRMIEARFLANLSEKERHEFKTQDPTMELAPWDAELAEFVVSPDSPLIAKPLHQIAIKEKYGVTVAMIQRGHRRILAPDRSEMLLPHDQAFVLGTEEQLGRFKDVVESKDRTTLLSDESFFGLSSVVLRDGMRYVNKTIRECGLREASNGLVVGIERKGQRILNPDSSMQLLPDDLVWIVGDQRKIRELS